MAGIQINIDPQNLPCVSLRNSNRLNKKQIPHSQGIYFFLDSDSNPLYIGASSNINARITRNHEKISEALTLGASKVSWWLDEDRQLVSYLEAKLIKIFNPVLNRYFTKTTEHRVECISNNNSDNQFEFELVKSDKDIQLRPESDHIRAVETRPVTFTCVYCSVTVTQERFPSPLPGYCSSSCKQSAKAERLRSYRQVQKELSNEPPKKRGRPKKNQ